MTDREHALNLQAALQEVVDNSEIKAVVSCQRHHYSGVTTVTIRRRDSGGINGVYVVIRDEDDLGQAFSGLVRRFGEGIDLDPGLTWSSWVAGQVSLGTRWPNTGQVMKADSVLLGELSELPESFAMSTNTRGEFTPQEEEGPMELHETEDHEEEHEEEETDVESGDHYVVEAEGVPMLSLEILKAGGDAGPAEKRLAIPMVPTTMRAAIITLSICAAVIATGFFGTVGFLAYSLIK